MSSIGETLRRERVRRNLGLDQISRELKISPRFLEAIEDERFDRLPAGVFAKSFVRQYADLLELDGDELASEVQQMLAPPPVHETHAPNVPPISEIHVPRVEQWEAVGDRHRLDWSSSLPAAVLVVVVMLVCSGVYAFWQRARRPAVPTPPAVAQVTQAPVQQAPPPVTPPPAEQPPAPVEKQPQPPVAVNPETTAPLPKPTTVVNTPPKNEASRVATPVRVQVTADEPVWVLARADGKYLFSGTLEPNETKSVEGNDVVTLRLGNAGGVSILLNGKSIGAVGQKGQIREVQFTSGGFHIVAAPKPSLPLDRPI